MTTFAPIRISLALAALLMLGACSSKRAPLSSLGPDTVYQQGMAAYEARSFTRAIELLEHFTQAHLGDPRVPQARLTLGRIRQARGDHLLAAADFTRVLNESPGGPLSREARFGICESYRELSPRPALDQEYTGAALAHCESFAQLYPESPEAERARAWVVELNDTLARKAYQTGYFYFRRGAYDAGVVYFEDVLRDFPQSSLAPTALLRIVESYERIGYKEEADEARQRLLTQYPQSTEARSVQPTAAPPAA